MDRLGESRAPRFALKGEKLQLYVEQAVHHPPLRVASPAASLADAEGFLAGVAHDVMAVLGPSDHLVPKDGYSTRLAYLRGLHHVISHRWHDRGLFDNPQSTGLFASGLLDKARHKFISFRRSLHLDTSWQQVRGELRLRVERLIGRRC